MKKRKIYLCREDLKNRPSKKSGKAWMVEALIWDGNESEIDKDHSWSEFKAADKRATRGLSKFLK